MESTRPRFVHAVVLLITLVALGVVGHYSFRTAAQFERLGEKSIAEAGLWLARAKLKELEEEIIGADNRVFKAIDLSRPAELNNQWKDKARELSPSVRAVAIIDENENVVALSTRTSRSGRRKFKRLLTQRIIPDLKLSEQKTDRLRHLHRDYDGRSQLISYKAVRHRGRRHYLTAHHDVGYLVREVFPKLFVSTSGKEILNVINQDNRRVFGDSLSTAGDYVVGHRFPTTLYTWRLQVAPITAPLLKAKGRSSRFNQAALISLCLVLILLAVTYSLYTAEQQRKLANLKSDFIANVSHELKTPLSVIRMFSEMLLTGRVPEPGKQREYMETIFGESERLSGLIQNVLDFAAFERGKPHYEMHDRDLYAVVERAVDTFRYRLDRSGGQVVLRREGTGSGQARIDEQSILLAILNLLDNAAKYASGSPIEVTVDAHEKETRVSVRDRGPGIPASDLKRVFERFYRAEGRGATRGSGIGLSLVKQIATAHRGRAWAENPADGGARITIAVPTKPPSAASLQRFDTRSGTDIVARHG